MVFCTSLPITWLNNLYNESITVHPHFFVGPLFSRLVDFLHLADFHFRGFSLTAYQNYTILSVILPFTERGQTAKSAKMKGPRKKGTYSN